MQLISFYMGFKIFGFMIEAFKKSLFKPQHVRLPLNPELAFMVFLGHAIP